MSAVTDKEKGKEVKVIMAPGARPGQASKKNIAFRDSPNSQGTSAVDLIIKAKKHYEETIRQTLEEEAGEIDENELEEMIRVRTDRMVNFFAASKDQKQNQKLEESLIRRRVSAELRKNPPPNMYTRKFDFDWKDTSRFRKASNHRRFSRYDEVFPPVDILVVPTFDESLPGIGRTRRIDKTCIPDHQLVEEKVEFHGMERDAVNPFVFPKNVPEFMAKMEAERVKKREEGKKIPTKEKISMASQMQKEVLERIKPYQARKIQISTKTEEDPTSSVLWSASHGLQLTHIQRVSRKSHANYTTHRRNVFYAEYAIFARQKALQMMRDEEEAEEIGLKNYEYLSKYTSESLDLFLKQNDESTTKTSKITEEKTKENIVLSNEIRNLNLETSSLKNEILGLNESLKECKYYMKFLDGVARELMRQDEEEAYRQERREAQIREEIIRYVRQGLTVDEAQAKIEESNKEFASVRALQNKHKDMNTESAEFIRNLYEEAKENSLHSPVASRINNMIRRVSVKLRDGDSFSEENLLRELDLVGGDEQTDREELSGLVFTKPAQLLDIYLEVEDQNLTLIQHAQINEEMLEVVEKQIRASRKETELRSRELRDMINAIEEQTAATQDRITVLNTLIDMFTGGYYDVKGQEKLMKLLRKHVNKVYKASVGSKDVHLSAVLMLTSVEKNFEDIVRDLENMPTDVVSKISRDLDKDRREYERLEVEQERLKHREDRLAKSQRRNSAPMKHCLKRGRPMFFRSKPPKTVVQMTQQDLDKKAEEDEFNYYFGE